VENRWKTAARAAALAALVGVASSTAAHAGILGGVLGKAIKVGGIGFLVKQFGPEINKTINTLLQQKGVRYSGKTKVVPAFAVGSGAYVGAAQIQGEPARVDKAKYVATIEVPLDRFRGKAYFPVESLVKSGKALKRVNGAGVTAIIDFRI
jgi:hypothetical protein